MKDMTVAIMAFDSYSDVWEPFNFFFKKNWTDCNYPIYMITCNNAEGMEICERVILTSDRMEWTERLHAALMQIETPYVLIMLEDLYIDRKVNSNEIKRCIEVMKKDADIGCIRLLPNIKYKKIYERNSAFGEYLPGQAYRMSTHPSIWKREYLIKMTEEVMSAWDFEYIGTQTCCRYPERILCTRQTVVHFTNGIWRSKWTTEGVKLCKKNNLTLDFDYRPKYTFRENLWIKSKIALYHILGPSLSTKLSVLLRK